MNCRQFKKRLMEQPRFPDFGMLDAHASECAKCARVLREERHLAAAIALVRDASASLSASPALEQSLLAGFRDHQRTREQQASRRAFPYPYLRYAVAAAVVIAVGLVASVVFRRAESPRPAQTADSAATGTKAADVKQQPAAKTVGESSATGVVRKSTPGRSPAAARGGTLAARRPTRPDVLSIARVNDAAHPERGTRAIEATEFFPTMRLGAYEASSDLQLVRVSVSKATLDAFGVTVDPRLTNAPIKADVLLGPDGLARAVRFVRERN